MLKYLTIQLDDTATSFCHYDNDRKTGRLIDLDLLKNELLESMKENLTVHFVYPDFTIPEEYKEVIDTVEHADIVSSKCEDSELRENADVVVFNAIADMKGYDYQSEQAYVLRSDLKNLFDNTDLILEALPKVSRLNVVVTDVQAFDKESQLRYKEMLERLIKPVKAEYEKGHHVQLNILTDRILLDRMNNCNAGDEWIALAPDGKYYVCPAFYLTKDGYSIGSPADGLDIKNPQLYKLSHAPICRTCDAWQCKRCVWLNRNMTLEVNTPSHEQCVMAHLEREASRKLLAAIRELGGFMPDVTIPELDYLDPFDKILEDKGI